MEGQWASKSLAAGSIEVLEECGEMVVRFRSGVLVSCLVYLWFRVVVVDRVLGLARVSLWPE
ncbi:hypothetical protein NC653_030061 [Populus alba x Populus x berolinensis]|uniref:Uncharacterized protein n=1 Tax=Populus alba x Populus x berolinensis TaxID=444605 RepID=A0AAD6Q141_9ROSI|nr:hypothetical protein NC653_030061 [Populus alba x Populus x berolinensis]